MNHIDQAKRAARAAAFQHAEVHAALETLWSEYETNNFDTVPSVRNFARWLQMHHDDGPMHSRCSPDFDCQGGDYACFRGQVAP